MSLAAGFRGRSSVQLSAASSACQSQFPLKHTLAPAAFSKMMLTCSHGQCLRAHMPGRQKTLRKAPLLRACPVASSSRPSLAARRQQQLAQQSSEQAPSSSWALPLEAASALFPALALAAALPPAALADVEDALDEVVDAATDASAAPPTDIFVSIMFGTVVALLAVVTLGVAYLTLKTYLDQQQEKQDQESKEKFKTAFKQPPAAKAGSTTSSTDEETEESKRVRAKRDKARGFGGSS